MTNIKIVPTFITLIVAAGLLVLSPSMIWNAQAETYDNSYSYDKKDPKISHLNIQKINCGNSNVNVNGVDVTEIPQDNPDIVAANEVGPEAANTETGTGLVDRINFDRNLVNVCVNANDNGQTNANAEPQPQPPQIPLFECVEGSNLGAGAIVTNEQLCNAATPAEQCPEGTDLEDVWVVDADAEGACDVEAGAVTASTYENAGNLDTATPFTSTATCDTGDVATGGGYTVTGNPAAISNHRAATGESWTVTATVTGSGPSLQAFVTCLNNPLSP